MNFILLSVFYTCVHRQYLLYITTVLCRTIDCCAAMVLLCYMVIQGDLAALLLADDGLAVVAGNVVVLDSVPASNNKLIN